MSAEAGPLTPYGCYNNYGGQMESLIDITADISTVGGDHLTLITVPDRVFLAKCSDSKSVITQTIGMS